MENLQPGSGSGKAMKSPLSNTLWPVSVRLWLFVLVATVLSPFWFDPIVDYRWSNKPLPPECSLQTNGLGEWRFLFKGEDSYLFWETKGTAVKEAWKKYDSRIRSVKRRQWEDVPPHVQVERP